MAKSPKKPAKPTTPRPGARPDLNQIAARIVAEATGQKPKTPDPDAGKMPGAISRGRKGGEKGGPARASKLPPSVRAEIARKAAAARWAKRPKNDESVDVVE